MIAVAAPMLLVLAGVALVVGTLASAVYAGLETGMYVLNRIRLELRKERNDPPAQRLSAALDRPQELLTALLIGTNAANYLVAVALVGAFALLGSDDPDYWAIAVGTPLLCVVGQMLPKNLFRVAGETLTYRMSWIISGTMTFCTG